MVAKYFGAISSLGSDGFGYNVVRKELEGTWNEALLAVQKQLKCNVFLDLEEYDADDSEWTSVNEIHLLPEKVRLVKATKKLKLELV